jgi:hypothetical protein
LHQVYGPNVEGSHGRTTCEQAFLFLARPALLIGVAGASAQAPEHKSAPGLSKESTAASGPAKSATRAEHGTAEHRSAAQDTPKAAKESPKADAASTANEPKSHQGAANDTGAKGEPGARDKGSPNARQGANEKASQQPESAESTSQKPDTHRSAAETGKQPGSSATKTGRSAATDKPDASKADASKTDPGNTGQSTTGANTTNSANTQTGRSATSTSTTTGAGDRANTTTQTGVSAQGRSGSATSVQIDPQKQERIRTAISSTKVENISHADFSVSVGTRVPERYQFHPLPTEIVDIVPEYRGFDYMVVDNEVVIVNPSTREIVYTMNEGRSAGMNRPSVDCR